MAVSEYQGDDDQAASKFLASLLTKNSNQNQKISPEDLILSLDSLDHEKIPQALKNISISELIRLSIQLLNNFSNYQPQGNETSLLRSPTTSKAITSAVTVDTPTKTPGPSISPGLRILLIALPITIVTTLLIVLCPMLFCVCRYRYLQQRSRHPLVHSRNHHLSTSSHAVSDKTGTQGTGKSSHNYPAFCLLSNQFCKEKKAGYPHEYIYIV